MHGKVKKMILDDPDADHSQNIVDCSLSELGLPVLKIHEHSSTTFSVIRFNVQKRPTPYWKSGKIDLGPGSRS